MVEQQSEPTRRGFFSRMSSLFMAGGLLAGYGTIFAYAFRFLYPSGRDQREWQFVTDLAGFAPGSSLNYSTPAGQKVVISRLSDAGDENDFIALSSVCPHLGCAVHWEAVNNRFFCPCHNGAFDPEGNPLSGPVKDANQPLTRFELMTDTGLLYIRVETRALVEQA